MRKEEIDEFEVVEDYRILHEISDEESFYIEDDDEETTPLSTNWRVVEDYKHFSKADKSKPRVNFCYACSKPLQGEAHTTVVFKDSPHVFTYHKSCSLRIEGVKVGNYFGKNCSCTYHCEKCDPSWSKKGEENGRCNRTACDTTKGVIWFNHSTRKWYCAKCARDLNHYNQGDAHKLFGHELCTIGKEVSNGKRT